MASSGNRVEAVLRKPIIQAGVLRQAGELVCLRPDQAERLSQAGIIESSTPPPQERAGKRKSTSTRGDDNE